MEYPIKTLHQLRPLLLGFRKRAGMTQATLASLLGITQQSYAKIEANPSTTSVERLFTILRLLGGEMMLSDDDDRPAPPPADAQRARAQAPQKLLPPSPKKESW